MALKSFRTIYIHQDLDSRLIQRAQEEQSSVSRLVRIALERHLAGMDARETGDNRVTAPALEA
jgi:hypothetical protein